MTITKHDKITAMAAAIANARGMRRGSPPIKNILELLQTTPTLEKLYDEVMEDAEEALDALKKLEEAASDEAR